MAFREYTGYLFLAVLGIATWLLVEYTSQRETVHQEVPQHSADFFSNGYTKIEIDEQGLTKSELFADKMTHFSDDNTIEMDKPVMTFYSGGTPTWKIRSETGLLSSDRENLFLNGNVFIVREKEDENRKMKVNTSNLRVKPEENYAETDDWAELITPTDWVSGTGMKVFFKDPVYLELLSNVRSRYEKL